MCKTLLTFLVSFGLFSLSQGSKKVIFSLRQLRELRLPNLMAYGLLNRKDRTSADKFVEEQKESPEYDLSAEEKKDIPDDVKEEILERYFAHVEKLKETFPALDIHWSKLNAKKACRVLKKQGENKFLEIEEATAWDKIQKQNQEDGLELWNIMKDDSKIYVEKLKETFPALDVDWTKMNPKKAFQVLKKQGAKKFQHLILKQIEEAPGKLEDCIATAWGKIWQQKQKQAENSNDINKNNQVAVQKERNDRQIFEIYASLCSYRGIMRIVFSFLGPYSTAKFCTNSEIGVKLICEDIGRNIGKNSFPMFFWRQKPNPKSIESAEDYINYDIDSKDFSLNLDKMKENKSDKLDGIIIFGTFGFIVFILLLLSESSSSFSVSLMAAILMSIGFFLEQVEKFLKLTKVERGVFSGVKYYLPVKREKW